MNRVFHVAGIFWFITTLAVLGLGWPVLPLLVVAAGFALWIVFWKKRLPLWIFSAAAAVCICALSLGFLDRSDQWMEDGVTVRGVVTDRIFSDSSTQIVLRSTDGIPALKNARILIYSRPGVDESIGDVVEYALRLDAPARLRAKGFDFQAFGTQPKLLGHMETVETRLSRLRGTIAGRFTRLLPQGEGALLSAVLLGRTENISYTLRRSYAKAGLSHLLAASGVHLSVMLSLSGILLQGILSRKKRLLIEIAIAAAFVALTGFPPSMTRAALMLLVCRGALLLGRDSDALNSLGFSVILILLQNPYAVFSIGLQLSYLATMGICTFSEPMANWISKTIWRQDFFQRSEEHPRTARLLSMITVTLSAQLLTAPLICWWFGRFSLVSPLSNLLAAVPAIGMLFFGILCAFFGFFPIFDPFCRLCALMAGLSAKCVTYLAQWCASLPGSSLPILEDHLIFWMSGTLLLFIILWYLRCNRIQAFWAAQWAACALAFTLCTHLFFWGYPVTVCVSQYGGTVALLYGGQAAVIGVPEKTSEAEHLLSLFEDCHITSICLLVPEKASQLETAAAQQLIKAFPPENVASLDEFETLEAILFGNVSLSKQTAHSICVTVDHVVLVKSFAMDRAQGHILINGRNEVISAPKLRLSQNDRYNSYTRIFLPVKRNIPEDES